MKWFIKKTIPFILLFTLLFIMDYFKHEDYLDANEQASISQYLLEATDLIKQADQRFLGLSEWLSR